MKIKKEKLKVLIKEELKTVTAEQTENPYMKEISRLQDLVGVQGGKIGNLKRYLKDMVEILKQKEPNIYQLKLIDEIEKELMK